MFPHKYEPRSLAEIFFLKNKLGEEKVIFICENNAVQFSFYYYYYIVIIITDLERFIAELSD